MAGGKACTAMLIALVAERSGRSWRITLRMARPVRFYVRDVPLQPGQSPRAGGGNCVEVAADRGVRINLIRDTTDRADVTLALSLAAWRRFTAGLR